MSRSSDTSPAHEPMTKLRRIVPRIRVLFVSDVRLYREALAAWSQRRPIVRMVAAVGHRDAAVAVVREQRPDIALIDMRMPDGCDVARVMLLAMPELKLVGLGLAETEDNVLAYAGAGFAGYVPREAPLDDLVEILRGIARGEVRYSRSITAALLHRLAGAASAPVTGRMPLTPRETEIVRLIDDGLSNREIARRLAIEPATVKNHVHNLLEKLHVSRRGEAAARLRRPPVAPVSNALNQRI
jgi:two-component system, NarL family, nitrate/nitrite response regulator NarL